MENTKPAAHSIISIQKYKRSGLAAAQKHNEREIETLNADESRRNLNRELVESAEGRTYTQLIDERLEMLKSNQTRAIRKDAVYAISVVLAIPEKVKDEIDTEKWAEKSTKWLEEYFTKNPAYGSNLISAKLHMDEITPHIHAMIIPIDENGRLNSREYINGPAQMREIHTSYAEAVKEFGLERGIEYSAARHQDVKAFYSHINECGKIKMPEFEKDETLESYKAKCEEQMHREALRLNGELKRHEAEIDERILKAESENVKLQLELKDARHENAEIKKEISGMEREFDRSIPEIRSEVRAVEAIKNAIEAIEDPTQQMFVRNQMNSLIVEGKKIMKKEREKEKISAE